MTKHWQDKFEGWLKKFFVDEEFNRQVAEAEKKQLFLQGLKDKGDSYDSGNEWWERKLITNGGKESILEVNQELENGEWKQLMIGYGDHVFYEEKVDASV